jgi:hypothetical protein
MSLLLPIWIGRERLRCRGRALDNQSAIFSDQHPVHKEDPAIWFEHNSLLCMFFNGGAGVEQREVLTLEP